ncbi:hypothetical protein C8A03DRAFT_15766 [Achaetomium macrosporum]|uniref:Uncharacterized protein n=1 Tax=Achaetomium macrosporum TaxID=79813 RepID=A0AAN7C9F2_9PEZI|nr:hypothetical protein C8A03DRAFT_15766 [Achaetomium macrosporum]
MDWPLTDPEFFDEDLDSVFVYQPRRSKAVYWFVGDEECNRSDITEYWLKTDQDVTRWLEEVDARKSSPGLAVILAARAEQPDNRHNPALLEYLPFTRTSFERIVAKLPLHGDTARIINRSDVAFFTDIDLLNSPANAICNVPDELMHPLLLPGILVELERERHMSLVQQRVLHLLQRVRALSKGGGRTISTTSQLVREEYSVDLWIEVWQLRTALEAWMVELGKMDGCCARLEEGLLVGKGGSGAGAGGGRGWDLVETGRRVQKRLREIRQEYKVKVKECSMVVEGMALSAQLSWNQIGYQDAQANLKIASDTREDSNQMRSIAFLTMFFLPATFLSSLFSMSFFKWDAAAGEHVVSPYLWIYPVLAISITAIVVGVWLYFTRRRRGAASTGGFNEKLSV